MSASASVSPSLTEWKHERDYKVVHLENDQSALFFTGNHRLFLVDGDLGRRLEQGFDRTTADEARELKAIERAGLLGDVNRSLLSRSTYEDGSNLALNINLTGSCNLACTYCFADGGDYGRITNRMQSHTVDFIFDFIAEHVTKSKVVRFEFFGGEPLLNFSRIQEICERADAFTKETGVTFINRISTNLTVLPKGSPELFRDRNFIVSISIDGGRKTHDKNRPTKTGEGSFDDILENCKTVREVGGDQITMVARMTVFGTETPLIDDVRELWELNLFDYFQIFPGVTASSGCGGGPEAEAEAEPEGAVTIQPSVLDEFREFGKRYHEFFQEGTRFRGTLEYERMAQMILEGKMALGFCGGGSTYYTISPDDSIMPCHRLVGEEKFQAGTGKDGITEDLSAWTMPVDKHPICSNCWARYACGGNCREENFVATGDLRTLNSDTCQHQLLLMESTLRLLGRHGAQHNPHDRSQLDDMFVSCGRPVVDNDRQGYGETPPAFEHFRPLSLEPAAGRR